MTGKTATRGLGNRSLADNVPSARSDGLQWPHRDGLKWPHFASVDLRL
jgi:hypothetical protein